MSRQYGKGFRAILRRYHALVDKEFTEEGLTPKERYKMERLGHRIDEYDEPFYAPIIAMLEAEDKGE